MKRRYGAVHSGDKSYRWDWLGGVHPFWWGFFAGVVTVEVLIGLVEGAG